MSIEIMRFICATILLFNVLYLLSEAEPVEDKRALLDFIDNIYHSRNLNWDEATSVCSGWTGITCNSDNSRVIAVRLPAIGLKGRIPMNTLGRLSELQILSLRSNGISGPFPPDLLNLGNLTGLFLQLNHLEGPLPLDFSVWKNLTLLNLSDNEFNGSIPLSISNLTHLTSLNLANNWLSGDIPDLDIPSMKLLNLSNNNLTGVIPQSLLRFPSSSFSGNNVSQENSLSPVMSPSPAIEPKHHTLRFSESAILGITVGGCAVVFTVISLLLIFTYKKEGEDDRKTTGNKKPGKQERSSKNMVSGNQDANSRLTFFEGCALAFDLEDLLRASAEVLGKGTFGTTYKAALEDATVVAVKRLKEVFVGRKDFERQMETVGNIRHENVAPLRAYYYSKDEKLIVYDYFDQGSLSSLLHANRGEKRVPLDWEIRLQIATGAARGIAYIHSQSGGKFVHGDIKASNIFLNSQQYGCVSDLGLAILMNPISPPVMRVAGYRAPEVTNTKKVSQASDVYSFGVVLLELLTGKSPVHISRGEEVTHLVRWVNSVVREEWTGEVFDAELLIYPNIEEEMVSLLQIGLSCVARMPEERPRMVDVVSMVEDIRNMNRGSSPSLETRSLGSTPTFTPKVDDIGSSSLHI
ncbi:Leucine-rich repeat protein kinase family protein [Dorcoceras hygrometricum]|uniref:Leucine-rich repeat protein kinase family protein n=1 Tax=Dorcoceras hygrometricum TaxID=472368 RepID=A0A2Z7BW68_9LAMI|nr:Leucine-rich repeat protein kinase family protein [Dorcoceras hygrometricum]